MAAYTTGDLPDYQMSALAMAVFFKGMTFEEVTNLTEAMMQSGEVLDMSDVGNPTADKHSTGGIGDKISIPLAPIVAACGVAVPMISGRGLGITGGTLDKLESIPGYNANQPVDRFKAIVKKVGCSIIGQTDDLAPADKKLYALRDVTGTVPSIPLIAASIMSKKLAEGAETLVLDVKFGSGAFMSTFEQAKTLAKTLVEIGTNMGRNMCALLTAMDQPLGTSVGNALEVAESVAILKNAGPSDTTALTKRLAVEMVIRAKRCNEAQAVDSVEKAFDSGSGVDALRKMVEAHSGDPAFIDRPEALPSAPLTQEIEAAESGYIQHVDARQVGRAVLMLGGGRRRTPDAIDPAVGVSHLRKAGDKVDEGQPLLKIHARDEQTLQEAVKQLDDAIRIEETAPPKEKLIHKVVTAESSA